MLVDGWDLRRFPVGELRRNIAYVDQNTFLFSDTVRNNLRLGNENLSEEELQSICRDCQAEAFIQNLPLGYDMPLDENGQNLSGGQRQRLAIARALARHPQLLILDEATSNLDTATESAIRDTISRLDKNLACILIAHRLTTVRACDRIYVMKEGQIVESGSYESLMKRQGEFYRLWNMQ